MLLRGFALFASFSLLSGCTLISQEQHQQTQNKLDTLETNVSVQLTDVQTTLSTQDEQILALNSQLVYLKSTLENVQRNQARDFANHQEPKIVYKEKIVPVPMADNKVILGEQEWVWLEDVSSNFTARVDTGATTSSLNAVDVQEFERDGKTWVRFNLAHANGNSDKKHQPDAIIEAPVKRWVKIRQSTSEDTVRRPVVELWIRLGDLHEKAQFTLADRSQMEFPFF